MFIKILWGIYISVFLWLMSLNISNNYKNEIFNNGNGFSNLERDKDFQGQMFLDGNVSDKKYIWTTFAKTKWKNCKIENTSFYNSQFQLSEFDNCKVRDTVFVGVNFENTVFNNTEFKNNVFISCKFTQIPAMDSSNRIYTKNN